ncbi:transferase [Bacteroides stercorirosoris]|uniref:Transferase n=1 Tax=Bacteroides stercorirosoris TaxID=871324 RepID=A0A413GXG1_9BACE|nr:transferase [Bacteroides stercorirosoris]
MNREVVVKNIYVLGIGHNTPVFVDLAEACGYTIAGLYHYNDDRTGQVDHDFEIVGSFEYLFSKGDLSGMDFLLTMGDNMIRAELLQKIVNLGGRVPSIIHPTAVISRFAFISSTGVYISAFTHVQADTFIDEGSVILSGVNISHTNRIGKYCFVAGGATIGAYTTVEDYVFIGQSALTISAKVKRIGHHACIGARALVTKDVESGAVMMGSPARTIRSLLPANEVL